MKYLRYTIIVVVIELLLMRVIRNNLIIVFEFMLCLPQQRDNVVYLFTTT
jgi:hypothetical protein